MFHKIHHVDINTKVVNITHPKLISVHLVIVEHYTVNIVIAILIQYQIHDYHDKNDQMDFVKLIKNLQALNKVDGNIVNKIYKQMVFFSFISSLLKTNVN